MTAPTRDIVAAQVKNLLASVSNRPNAQVLVQDETTDLQNDLGIWADAKAALATDYTRIAKGYDHGTAVTRSEAAKCDTVKVAIDTVFKHAQGPA